MSVLETHNLACPHCAMSSHLVVTFTGSARLTSDGSEDCGDHEWDDDSPIRCENCGETGTVGAFRVDENEEGASEGVTLS